MKRYFHRTISYESVRPMELERLAYDPASLLSFYEEALASMGALCERTWHDRLEVVAEGRAAQPWQTGDGLHEVELLFAPGEVTTARDAAREVFPGAPLTFRLAEAIRPAPLPLERVLLGEGLNDPAPPVAVAEKLWRAQFPETSRWRLVEPFKTGFHFSLVVLARCEIQAIDQHWSLHRFAVALPHGEADPALAQAFGFAQAADMSEEIPWPKTSAAAWQSIMQQALGQELAANLTSLRQRQETYLRRELERVDDYFENYERELAARAARTGHESGKLKAAERLAAAKSEHARRRADQVARHEIRVVPHWDALLLVAERGWLASLEVERARVSQPLASAFVPRARRWFEE